MQSLSKLICVWLLAVLLPIQSIAAMTGHCSRGSAGSASGEATRLSQMQMPCAHSMRQRDEAPNQKHQDPYGHESNCSACCAVPTAQARFDAVALPTVAPFALVIDQFAQFVPPGLKRPPTSL
jgi:hypothetical protein